MQADRSVVREQLQSRVTADWAATESGQPGLSTLAEPLQQLIDDLPEQIALLTDDCEIFAANAAWKEAVEEHGYMDALPGRNYREFCSRKAAEGYEPAIEALEALDDILSGRRSYWQLIYNGRSNWRGRDYQITFHRIRFGGRSFISVTRFDLTEIVELRNSRDDLARSLIEGQAAERERMGREIHDSVSQPLAAIGLMIGRLKHDLSRRKKFAVIKELEELLSEVHQEIRSISYLAHPPKLEKLGLSDALKVLVEGFGRRTGLEASFDIAGDATEMPKGTESTIYRLAQEGLSNVHRHSRATRVRLLLAFRRAAVHFVVADNGAGISADTLGTCAGVGLSSMRSRLSDLGGRLSIHGLSPGTAIIATVPIARHRQIAEASTASRTLQSFAN